MERLDCPEMRRLERFRDYLRLLARLQFTGQALGRLDLSDVVRRTLVEAFDRRGQFHDRTDAGQAAW